MPEGDTVHTLARLLGQALTGQTLNARLRHRRPWSELMARQVVAVTSQGKHLFIEFADGWSLRTHLGLYGSWHRYRPGEPWHKPERQASLVLLLNAVVLVCFNAREVELIPTSGQRTRAQHHHLGPDLTLATPAPEVLMHRALERLLPDTLAVDLLLDQWVACGIGNIYKCEVLFLEGCHPRTRLSELDLERLSRLYGTAGRLLRRNLDGGPRITREAEDGRGRLWVYRRAGRPCFRCGTPVLREMLGSRPRSTYWCPGCQHEGSHPSAEDIETSWAATGHDRHPHPGPLPDAGESGSAR